MSTPMIIHDISTTDRLNQNCILSNNKICKVCVKGANAGPVCVKCGCDFHSSCPKRTRFCCHLLLDEKVAWKHANSTERILSYLNRWCVN